MPTNHHWSHHGRKGDINVPVCVLLIIAWNPQSQDQREFKNLLTKESDDSRNLKFQPTNPQDDLSQKKLTEHVHVMGPKT